MLSAPRGPNGIIPRVLNLLHLSRVDYLVIGHLSMDLSSDGARLGGTAAYAGLTARALGLSVGIVTALKPGTDLARLHDIPIVTVPSQENTTFENIVEPGARRQVLHARAARIGAQHVPEVWRTSSIVHLGPIANELDPGLPGAISPSLLGVTPQGWMRTWDASGQVRPGLWDESDDLLAQAGAVVLSMEDVAFDLELVEAMAQKTRVLCVTDGPGGAVVYWHGDRRRFRAPVMQEVDATGAGDIFAAAFFTRLQSTRDPWEAARMATLLASRSVARPGLDAIPTRSEIEEGLVEVLT